MSRTPFFYKVNPYLKVDVSPDINKLSRPVCCKKFGKTFKLISFNMINCNDWLQQTRLQFSQNCTTIFCTFFFSYLTWKDNIIVVHL